MAENCVASKGFMTIKWEQCVKLGHDIIQGAVRAKALKD